MGVPTPSGAQCGWVVRQRVNRDRSLKIDYIRCTSTQRHNYY